MLSALHRLQTVENSINLHLGIAGPDFAIADIKVPKATTISVKG
jgi:hypothetical protein